MNVCRLLVENPGGKRPLGRPRLKWVDNFIMDLRKIGMGGGELTGLIWLRIRTSGELL
jgi:hypothetical protein